jgi:hypothetical protein
MAAGADITGRAEADAAVERLEQADGSRPSAKHAFETASPSLAHLDRSRFADRPPSVDKYAASEYVSRQLSSILMLGFCYPGHTPERRKTQQPGKTARPSSKTTAISQAF